MSLSSGNSVYFDNTQRRIGPEHVMASGALPPGFPPVEIDGDLYWDGGIVSNSPLTYVADECHGESALVFQVDVFSAAGPPPENLAHAAERVKDIQYSSKARFNTERLEKLEVMRGALKRVLDKLPRKLQNDPDVKALRSVSNRGKVSLVHVINRHVLQSSQFKDCEFSRATVNELWNAGLADLQRTLTDPASLRENKVGERLTLYQYFK